MVLTWRVVIYIGCLHPHCSLACSMVEAILGGGMGSFIRHGVFIRGGRKLCTSRGRLLDRRRLFESGRLLDHFW